MGRILSLPGDVIYIHEPFNLESSTEVMPYRFRHWFPHVPDIEDRAELERVFGRMLGFHYPPPRPAHWAWHRGWKSTVLKRLEYFGHRTGGHVPLVKDPIALFSAAELAGRFDLNVVCMIRHPLAFCSSLKKWDWKFPFSHLVEQPQLMKRFFEEESDLIQRFAEVEQPVVNQAALLWNLFHKVIRRYQDQHPGWIFLRHEDMVADPMARFEELYQKLGLNFTPEIAGQLRGSLSAKNGETGDAGYKARDATTVTQTWKSRLTADEVEHVLNETEAIRGHFYPDNPA